MADELNQLDGAEPAKKGARRKEKPVEEIAQEALIDSPDGNNGHSDDGGDSLQGPEVHSVQFGQLTPGGRVGERSPLDLILDVQLQATVELGRSRLVIRDILSLGPGSVVELDKLAGEPADLLVNGKPLARGEVVVIDENFGIRITEILAPTERINSLR